jgi:multiple sugar transport system permease protein
MATVPAAPRALPVRRRRVLRPALREAIEGYLFISPWLVGLVVFTLGPMLASLALSFTTYDIINPPVWNGLANYREALFGDWLVWHSLKVTAIYSFVSVPLGLVGSFLVALLLNQRVRGLSVFRAVYYLPVLVPPAAGALLWAWIFNPDFGLLNTLLSDIGIQGPPWLINSRWALPSVILMSLWGIGGPMLIYLAGLQGIPTTLYEAATIDGATALHRLRDITIPMMTPVIFFNLVLGVISSFQVFTVAYILTQGGPHYATQFYVLHLYQQGFRDFRMGYASALAWILFVIVLAMTLLFVRSAESWVYHEGKLRGR